MIENGCAFLCFIFSAVCAFLTAFYMMEGDVDVMVLVTVFGLLIALLSCYMLVRKNLF